MQQLYRRLALVLILCGSLVTGCVLNTDITAYCNRIEVTYSADFSLPSGTIRVFRASDNHLAGEKHVSPGALSGSYTVKLDDDYPDGTAFIAKYYQDGGGTQDLGQDTCGAHGHHISGSQWFDPGDQRLNRQAYAYAAIYCDDDNQRVAIYGIHSQATDGGAPGKGFPAIFVPYSGLPPTPTLEQGNTLIQQYANIGFYRLTSGEYQVNAGPDNEGKTYVVVFDGCPNTTMHAYMLQNGVMTPSEVYPR